MNHNNMHLVNPHSCCCMFCFEFGASGYHARACPGAAGDIRTWTESTTDKDGEAVRKAGD